MNQPELNTQDIIKLYTEDKLSARKIGELYGTHHRYITDVLRSNDIPIRSKSEQNRTLYHDPSVFKEPLTPQAAYWLGFIAADGCVRRRKGEHIVQVKLSISDIDHVQKLKEFLKSEHKVITGTDKGMNKDYCMFMINSEELYKTLQYWGIHPRKTYTLYFPYHLPEELWSSYILGFFDGDGWITFRNRDNLPRFGVGDMTNIIYSIHEILIDNCELNNTKINVNKRGFKTLHFSGIDQVSRIRDYLYSHDIYSLPRKKEKMFSF